MKRVQVHEKTQQLTNENLPIEERVREINGTPHVCVGDTEDCKFPREVKSAFYKRSQNAIEVNQELIDDIIRQEHMCRCDNCDVTRLIKFLTKRRGCEVFVRTVR